MRANIALKAMVLQRDESSITRAAIRAGFNALGWGPAEVTH
jgi:hypothetical protein